MSCLITLSVRTQPYREVLSVSFFVSCTKRIMLITLASRFFESMDKEVLPMSDFELLMIVFAVLSLLIMAYNGRK